MIKLQVTQKVQTENSTQVQLSATSDDSSVGTASDINISVTPDKDNFVMGGFYGLDLQPIS
jgi:hypothetical protein